MTATGPIPGAAAELAVEVRDLHKNYALPRESLWQKPPQVHALRGVSLSIEKGRSFGIVVAAADVVIDEQAEVRVVDLDDRDAFFT